MRLNVLPLICAMALYPLAAHADDAVTLAYNLKAGMSSKYKTVAHVPIPGGGAGDVIATNVQTSIIKEIKPDGSVVVEVISDEASFDMGTGPQPLPNPAPITITYDKSGKLKELKGADESSTTFSPDVYQILQMTGHILFPDHPVKSGDNWEALVDDPVVKGKKVTVKDTYSGSEIRDGKTVWKIEQDVTAPVSADGTILNSKVTAYLDPSSGDMIYEKSDITNLPSVNYGMLNWKAKMVLLPPASTDDKKTDTPAKP